MTTSPTPVTLEFDLPAQPVSLQRLAGLMQDPSADLPTITAVIESDLSLAAAVMKAVNSPFYGLRGAIGSVQQAVTFLGMRELSAIAFERTLRATFPDVPELHAVWDRARQRGALMGRLAQALSMEAWSAHSAGLFEECGKAILYRHAPEAYPLILRRAVDEPALLDAEQSSFGITHDELGAQLCERWGMTPAAVASVRHHVVVQSTGALPRVPHRYICVLSALADALMQKPDQLEAVAGRLAPQAMLDQTLLLAKLDRIQQQMEDALTRG